ncbi:hypothetical protein E2C01_058184 [Portunus trituberculatus]|uniref:Uncharacterized protein n=1 Tax=Portunus trituberculatus TaxID=210409 RepID=A0A5B7H5D9_PORTR|nr:hypothetical protein [Portunus trituberculatus]
MCTYWSLVSVISPVGTHTKPQPLSFGSKHS